MLCYEMFREATVNTRRLLLLSVGVAVMIALGGVAILLMGPRTDEVSRQSASKDAVRNAESSDAPEEEHSTIDGLTILTEEEALAEAASWYAKDFGVSQEEAVRRLEMQDDPLPSRLERELKKTERDAFAGLWLRHKPDYGITAATAGEPEAMMEKVEPYVEGTQWEGTVNIKRVEATEAELNAARAEVQRIIDRLRMTRVSSDLNVFKNRAEFYVADKARFERKLRASGQELPAHVVVLEGVAMPG